MSDINTHSVTSGDEPCGPWAFYMASMILRVIQPMAIKQTDADLGSKMRLKAGEPTSLQ